MSVISYGREPGYPKSKFTVVKHNVVTTHQDRYRVLVDNENDVGQQISLNLPFYPGQFFEDGSYSRLKELALSRDSKNRLLWYTDLSYEPMDDTEAEDQNKPPDLRKAEWAWDFETQDLLWLRDCDTGEPLMNSADEPFEVTSPFPIPVLTIEKFQESFDPSTIVEYVCTRNSEEFWGAPAGCALLSGIRDRRDTTVVWNGQAYRRVTYTIKFRVPSIPGVIDGWKEYIMDRGTFYFDSSQNKQNFTTQTGGNITGNLDGHGGKLDDGDEPHFLEFNQFPEKDFADLGIDYQTIVQG